MEALVGTALGGFKLIQEIGSGPTGQTYAAVDGAGGPVVVKVIHSGLSLFTRAEAFWSELRKVSALSHPHITVGTAADWSKSGRFFLSVELLEGLSLEAVLKQHGRLPAAQALLVVGQVCLAVEAAHQEEVVHGALKPRNIFLLPRRSQDSGVSVRVLDFATRCLLPSVPQAGVAGTAGVPEPAYLAPEQFGGAATSASDIYSLGVILFEVISGRRPFAGGYAELAEAHQRLAPELPAGIPEELAAVLRQALAKAPEQRFPTVAAFRTALESWAAGGPAALDEAPLALFAKDEEGDGVGRLEGDQTVRVSVDELAASLMDREAEAAEPLLERTPKTEPSARSAAARGGGVTTMEKGQPMPDVKKQKVPEDQELAAIAEKAATPLRSRPESTAAQNLTAEQSPAAAQSAAAQSTTQPSPPKAGPARPTEARPTEARPTEARPTEARPTEARPTEARPTEARPTEAYFDEDGDLVELPLERSVRAFVQNLLPVTPPPRKARSSGNGGSMGVALERFVDQAKHLNDALPPPVVDDRRLAELARVPVIEPPAPVVTAPTVTPSMSAPLMTATQAPPRAGILVPSLIAFLLGGAVVFGAYKLFLEKRGTEVTSAVSADHEPGTAGVEPGTTPGTTSGPAAVVAAKADAGASPTAVAPRPDAGATKPDTAATATGAPDAAPSAAGVEPTPPKKAVKKARKTAPRKETVSVKPKHGPKTKKSDDKKDKKGKKGGSDWVDPFSQ